MTHDNTSPQVEDGHTRLANELLEAMCLAGFSARQWAIVMAVVRKTFGYGKKSDDISLGQLSSMTGIAKPHASRAVNSLVAAGVLRRSAGTFGNSLSLNKRYKQWSLVGPAAGVADSVTLGLPNRQPQKETLQKKEKHPPIPPKGEEGDPEGFAEAWAAYPKRLGGNPRGAAVKAWRARLRSGVTAMEMIAGVHGYAAHCRAEDKVGTSFVMMAATFFGPDLRFRDFAESPAGPGPQGASRSAGVVPGSPLDIDTNPAWLAQTGYASVWEAISDGCTEHTYRWFRDGKRIPKEGA